eukprot:SAG31_NODE_10326_length_1153_cov_1.853890_1_plen_92_part_10
MDPQAIARGVASGPKGEAEQGAQVHWYRHAESLLKSKERQNDSTMKEELLLILANEYFDALPSRQFVWQKGESTSRSLVAKLLQTRATFSSV